ncbi:hypothetical protein BXP70_25705 [Hymenobacter crusticola]|uniref:Uncharacterized protein n=1 Tax=Hymenobacter crusticola TaxID=1770526 RepID=A0A243W6P2_9BACT|nr:hypothetical protein BXP70_25705 [Hymenobacter crusticola]
MRFVKSLLRQQTDISSLVPKPLHNRCLRYLSAARLRPAATKRSYERPLNGSSAKSRNWLDHCVYHIQPAKWEDMAFAKLLQ